MGNKGHLEFSNRDEIVQTNAFGVNCRLFGGVEESGKDAGGKSYKEKRKEQTDEGSICGMKIIGGRHGQQVFYGTQYRVHHKSELIQMMKKLEGKQNFVEGVLCKTL